MASCTNCGQPVLRLTAAVTGGLCVPCKAKWRHVASRSGVVADPSQWSDASRRSRSHVPDVETHYFDEFYWCATCAAPCVFTALQQQHAYEVEKRYLFQTRKLCGGCHARSKGA